MKTHIIIPVFNRRATTLECLRILRAQGVLNWATAVVIDDGSTDGTWEAVRAAFPEAVMIAGSGDLWWGGGINVGMRHAMADGTDMILWLNDDCHPRAGALEALVTTSRDRNAITVAPCILRETGKHHYGGLRKTRNGLELVVCRGDEVCDCDTICGNCVCIPRYVVERIGGVDAECFPHYAGDADYGLRACAAGIPCLVVGAAVCDSSYGSGRNRDSWLLGTSSVPQLWRGCFHPKNGMLARCGWTFKIRHWGWRGAVSCGAVLARLVIISVIRLLIPRKWLVAVLGARNERHQRMEAVRRWEAAHPS